MRWTGMRRSTSATASSCTPSRRSTGRRAAPAIAVHALWASFVVQAGGQEDLLRRRQRLRRRRHLRARARAPSRSRAGAAADRRLRAALVHAQHPHEPGRGGAGAAAVRRAPRRSAITGARSASPTRPSSSRLIDLTAALRQARHRARAISRAAAGRRACRGLTGTRADERGGERATPSAEWRIAVIVSAFSSAHSLVP